MIKHADIELLLFVLEEFDRPDRRVDLLLDKVLEVGSERNAVPRYTASLDAAINLLEHVLPGWRWRMMSEDHSDSAYVAPDFRHPKYGEKHLAAWPHACKVDPIDYLGTDINRAPGGQPAMALLVSMLHGLKACTRENVLA